MFSSSYSSEALDLLTAIAKTQNPKVVVEVGTQQGTSALALGKGLSSTAKLFTYDLFLLQYVLPPYGETHANFEIASSQLRRLECNYAIKRGSGVFAITQHLHTMELLHIDICNHYDNLNPLLSLAFGSSTLRCILLEGGVENNWMKQYGFRPYLDLLQDLDAWNYVTFKFNTHNALTVVVRK